MHEEIDAIPLAVSVQPWLREIIGAAGLPDTLDREGAAIALGRLLGRPLSPETVRRWPIPYKVVAGCARYEVSDLIAYARTQYENAARRIGRRSLLLTAKVTGAGNPQATQERQSQRASRHDD